MEFELEFLKSLTIQQRFEMLEERNLFLKSLLYKNDDRATTTICRFRIFDQNEKSSEQT